MRTRLNEIAEWTIYKYYDKVYCEMRGQVGQTCSYFISYNAHSLPMASRLDIASQIRDAVYNQIIIAVRQ